MKKKTLIIIILFVITILPCFAKKNVYLITGTDKHTRSIEVITNGNNIQKSARYKITLHITLKQIKSLQIRTNIDQRE